MLTKEDSSGGGKFHFFPENFHLPRGSVLEAWLNWCLGNERLGYPPFETLWPDDFSDSNGRKRLSDYRFVMNKIERRQMSSKFQCQ